MTMFTAQEKKDLGKFLARAVNQNKVFSLEGLHGFMFGLAITPNPLEPSAWLPYLFDVELLAMNGEGMRLAENLFSAFNRMIQEGREGKLLFPFDNASFNPKNFQRLQEWALGFFFATNLCPEIWGMDDGNGENFETEPGEYGDGFEFIYYNGEDFELVACFEVIMGVAFPERIPEIFDHDLDNIHAFDWNDPKLAFKLFSTFPHVVDTLRVHAAADVCLVPQFNDPYLAPPLPRRVEKIGRNEPCPCGSGAKYKKCCGK